MPLLFFGLVPALPLAWCVLRFLRPGTRASLWARVQRGVGWQTVCVAPVLAVHVALLVVHHGFEWLGALAALFFGPWVLLGGASVQAVFEANVKDLTGHRRDTMMDNVHVYLGLTAFQALLLALIVALRTRSDRGLRDPLVWAVGLAVAANAALGITWPWWGT